MAVVVNCKKMACFLILFLLSLHLFLFLCKLSVLLSLISLQSIYFVFGGFWAFLFGAVQIESGENFPTKAQFGVSFLMCTPPPKKTGLNGNA